ncbi:MULTISPECIES: DUF3108 domain-containing protein [Corallococcus]|uniref:DUF3108 domain-containing protein n=1 Tax=Corallococcus TaxID=83461 RepID=UPI00117F2966|nr:MULTISPECIES: DUF3108 domain-containing protein [Corallococcus]NBD10648.1 DUF3108 domain-containing protein [Corallococcus silvisoli]TSC31887.1 DUF3108 domain-containing protein [Corallococcus sp. Z5C101001]
MRSLSRWGFTAAMVGLMGSALAHAQEPSGAAFAPGEQAQYRVRYLGLTAGTATVTVGAPMMQWGQSVWPIVSLAKSDDMVGVYPIKSRFVTYWDAGAQRVTGSDLHSEENRKRRRQRIQLTADGRSAKVIKQKESDAPRESDHALPEGTLDVAGATFMLRGQELVVGRSYAYPVFTGSKQFTMRATVEGRETLTTPAGARDTFRVRVHTEFEGSLASNRDMVAYLSADKHHVPVRIEADLALGTVVAELTDYKPGRVVTVARADNTDD